MIRSFTAAFKKTVLPLFLLLVAGIIISPKQIKAQDVEYPITMPAVFHNGLIFLKPVSHDGDTLRFFTDSADASLIYQSSVARLGLTTTSAIIQGQQQQAAFLPPFDSTRYIPSPLISDGLIPVRADERKPPHHQVILDRGAGIPPADGILGSTWFATRTWSINYREETFHIIPTGNTNGADAWFRKEENGHRNAGSDHSGSDHSIPISFLKEGDQRRFHFARLEVIIAGDTFSMVLKTGSHIILDDNGRKKLDHPDAIFPSGLISESVFETWRGSHPDWPVFENADSNYGSDVIEVPKIRIGRHTAGPVRFAVRRDEAFLDWFSQFTDKPVEGALGPDAFRNAHITLNYPLSLLIFHD